LIKSFVPAGINELWVCDITYWKLKQDHVYLSFVTDAYSHKIVGYHLGETMEADESIKALRMALSGSRPESHARPIHHSDRGIQYCSNAYVKLLDENNIKISMTENGDPRENAVAERINGIIKEEYLDNYEIDNIQDAKRLLDSVIELYNQERPHMSIGNFIPNEIHVSKQLIKTKRLWKNYYTKRIHL
jgi:transposase InsO family protein